MAADLGADYRRFRRSATFGAFGEGLVAVALPLLVVSLTTDPLAVAAVVAFQHLPWVLVAAFGTRLLRSFDRRTTIGATDTFRAVVAGYVGWTVLNGEPTLLALYAVAFAVGVGEILRDDGEADGADTLARDEEQPGVLGGLSARAMGALGGALVVGGVLYGVTSALPLLVNLGIFSIAALSILSVKRPVPPTPHGTAGSAAQTLREHGVAPEPGTASPTLVAALTTGASSAVLGMTVLLAVEVLGFQARAFGILLALLAAGITAGGLGSPAIGARFGIRTGLVVVLVVTAAAYVGIAALASPDLSYPAAALLVVAAATSMAAGVLVRALFHAGAGRPLEPSSINVFHLVVWAAIPVGALVGGLVGKVAGVSGVFVAAAVVAVAAAATTFRDRPVETPEERPAPVRAPVRTRSFSTR